MALTLNGSGTINAADITLSGNANVTGTMTSSGGGNSNFDSGTLYVDATNNRVGIGTSSPSYKLQATGGAADNNNTANVIGIDGENHSRLKVNTSTSGGYQASLVLSSGESLSSTTNEVKISTAGSQEMRFTTANAERMRIDSSGRVLIGKTSAYGASLESTAPLEVAVFQNTGGTGNVRFQNSGGSTVGYIQWTTTTQYNTSSDYRLKENITPMTGALEKIALLNPVNWTWKIDGSNGQGFIAHELQAVVPDCVSGEKDAVDAEGNPDYQGVDTSFLVATLVKAIQEQQTIIEDLETRIQALENPS